MTVIPSGRHIVRPLLAAICGALAAFPALADQTDVLSKLRGMSDGSWLKLNENRIADVFIPALERPLPDSSASSQPQSIISAWSSFGWDSNRSDMLLYGGGHANYVGNEVYRFQTSTMRWEVAALPSAVQAVSREGYVEFIPAAPDNGWHAPQAAHTYDNTEFLPLADRWVSFGGGAYNSGYGYRKVDGTAVPLTGPYFFDPAKADGSKVGGVTGSGVNPLTPGGEMWSNRDIYANLQNTYIPGNFIDGTSAYAVENGKEVIYKTAHAYGGTLQTLFRYTINDLADPALDTWEMVGYAYQQYHYQGTGAYDPVHKVFVRTGDSGRGIPMMFWNLNTAGPSNNDVAIMDFVGAPADFKIDDKFGIDYDPVSGTFLLWRGGEKVWRLAVGNMDGTGWTLTEESLAGGAMPAAEVVNGVLGKWHYARDLNAFVALEGPSDGNVWLYRPEGWVDPLPVPEPSGWALMLAGLGLIGGVSVRRLRGASGTR